MLKLAYRPGPTHHLRNRIQKAPCSCMNQFGIKIETANPRSELISRVSFPKLLIPQLQTSFLGEIPFRPLNHSISDRHLRLLEKTYGLAMNQQMDKRVDGSTAVDLEAKTVRMPYQDPPPPVPPHKPWMAWLIPTFAVVNIVFFAYSMYANDCPARHPPGDVCIMFSFLGRYSFEPLSINPLLGPAPGTLDTLGALDYKKIVSGEPWRLISCIWLHGGVIHLIVNMLSLLFIGIRLEQEFGFGKVGTLYIISGIGGSLMSALSIQSKISVGASGALFGLLGAMLSELIVNWTLYANKCAALLSLLIVIAVNMAVGMIPHVDSCAHIGGFISGFLLGFILLMRPQFGWVNQKHFPPGYDMNYANKPKHKVYQYVLWILAFVILVIWFMNNLIQLFGHHLLKYKL